MLNELNKSGAREGMHNPPIQHIGEGPKIAIFGPIRIATLAPKTLQNIGANESQSTLPSTPDLPSLRLFSSPKLNTRRNGS